MADNFKDLLENPGKYTFSKFKGTYDVRLVLFKDQLFIHKTPKPVTTSLALAYYCFNSAIYGGIRRGFDSDKGLLREVECLEKLDGLNSPKLVAHNDSALVREYITGEKPDPWFGDKNNRRILEAGAEALDNIHKMDVVVGDAHIKNLIYGQGKGFWIDFSGLFDEKNKEFAKAMDWIKFVYSTYTHLRNEDLAKHSAGLVSRLCSDEDVRREINDFMQPGPNNLQLFLDLRLPLFGELNEEIKKQLRIIRRF